MKTGIYAILCTETGEQYIGTATHWEKRIAQHVNKLRRGKSSNKKLQAAWDRYGPAKFQFKLLEECAVADLLARERYWVARTDSDFKGFNNVQLGSNGFLSHGMSLSPTFKSWDTMKQRCLNPNSPDYLKYGGAGIKICDRWANSFDNFLADMGERPIGTTLDRYPDKRGNYEPTNCRWATPAQQQRNLRSNVFIAYEGKTQIASDWSREKGIPAGILRRRWQTGVRGDALFAPTYVSFKGIILPDGSRPKRDETNRMTKITAFGRTQTLEAWAEELDINLLTLRIRLGRGYSIEKALTPGHLKRGKAGPRKGRTMITAFGRTQSLTAWAREYGIAVNTLKNRIVRAKMAPEEALRAPMYAQQRGK